VVPVSILDEASLDVFRDATWALTGLIRVYLRKEGSAEPDPEPLALPVGATISDVADGVHHDLGSVAIGARVWGPSARFPGQRVGREHVVQDGDSVEVVA
jgi:ribosome-interacting GTPase 1